MMNDTSRPSASGTTERVESLVGGQPVTPVVNWPENDLPSSTQIHTAARSGADVGEMLAKLYPNHRVIDFTGGRGRMRAWREEAWFQWWEMRARVKHRIGIHTIVPLEEWNTAEGSVRFVGDVCWLCDV